MTDFARSLYVLGGVLFTLVAASASALPVTVTFDITGGSIINGPNAATAVTSGTLVVTFPNAVSLYSAPSLATATIQTLSLAAPGVGTLTLMGFDIGVNAATSKAAFIASASSYGRGCCGTGTVVGSAPTVGALSIVSFLFNATGPAFAPRTTLFGGVVFNPIVGTYTTGGYTYDIAGYWTFSGSEVGRVPEPTSAPLLGLGIAALGVLAASQRRLRRRRPAARRGPA